MFAEDRGASSAAAARACATRRWILRSSNERAFLSAAMRARGFSGEGSVRRRRERRGRGGEEGWDDGGGGGALAGASPNLADELHAVVEFLPAILLGHVVAGVIPTRLPLRPSLPLGTHRPRRVRPDRAGELCAEERTARTADAKRVFRSSRRGGFPQSERRAGRCPLERRSRFAIPRRRRAPELGSGNLSSDGTGRSQFDANLSRSAIRSRRFSPASCRFTRCPPHRAARFDRPGITPCASPATRAPWCARAFGTPRASSDGL